MIPGKRYRLTRPTLSIDLKTAWSILIPEGEIVEVLDTRPTDQRMVNVAWNGRRVMMFHFALRAVEVAEQNRVE